ncbi:photosystem II 10 kDa polypeptide, chloroplastic-like [Solanum dulcamara]|uniref:photosystem II 10 kDa polypeptide, chloroplastic-like n=1 Tax=Solanum dulcamara TaxID=45834 RepID=UPI0024866347|nr:photosystem II 10 kDa polypeptide, chloroplastic-like [Solanum dulcamara]
MVEFVLGRLLKDQGFDLREYSQRSANAEANEAYLREHIHDPMNMEKKHLGINGGLDLQDGVDASGSRAKEKSIYRFVKKYGANVDGYSPIYNQDEWSPNGDVYVDGTTGLAIWAITLAGLLAGGALLVYNTSALAQ